MKRFAMLLGLGIILIISGAALADVPKLINFQGILRDGSGNPVPDAVYVIRFRIYDDSTAGANLWEEFDDVQTTDGLFNVRLGDTTNFPNGLFEGSVNRFVGVKVGGDPETTPRTRLISVPFAFHALKSDSAATAIVSLDLTCTGCVGTGDIDATQVQRRVIGTAPVGEYITAILQDGSVATASDQVGAASGWTDDGAVVRLSTGSDNVGIGTTSPQFGARLEVVDRVNVIGAGTSRVFIAKDADEYLEASYNAGFSRGQLSTFNSSQPLILQQTGGNVGIGTISPGSRLQVEGQISSSVTGGAAPGFTFTGDLNTGLFETVPDELGLATNGIDRLHITSGGSVGIGTTSPAKKLEVAGSIKVGTNDTVFSSNLSSNSPLRLQAPAGATRMYIDDATGNVGIGTTSPEQTLHVHKGSAGTVTAGANSVGIFENSTNGYVSILAPSGSERGVLFGDELDAADGGIIYSGLNNQLDLRTNGNTTRMAITSSGDVGIGTTAPSSKLHVREDLNGNHVLTIDNQSTGTSSAQGIYFDSEDGTATAGASILIFDNSHPSSPATMRIANNVTGGKVDFVTGLQIRLTVTNAGDVGIGTVSPAARLHVNGTAGNNTGVWSNLSDRRLKTDIEPIQGALKTVAGLQGVSFHWKDSQKDAQFGRVRGLIAQDVEKVIPEWIKTDPDGYKRLEPIGIDALLIEAIKELSNRSSKLETEVVELKNRIFDLEKTKPQAKVE